MNGDLESTLNELGPEYRDVVARLKSAREVEPSTKHQRTSSLASALPTDGAAVVAASLPQDFSRPSRLVCRRRASMRTWRAIKKRKVESFAVGLYSLRYFQSRR